MLGAKERVEFAQLLGREDTAGQASSTSRDAVARVSRWCSQVSNSNMTRAGAVSRDTGK